MSNKLTTITATEITVVEESAETSATVVYLSGLTSDNARSTMLAGLNQVAKILVPNDDAITAYDIPWHTLRFQHVQALRARLLDTTSQRTGKLLAPATVNRNLSALRGVMKTAWLLGQLSAENYHKAAAVKNVRNEVLPAGRDIAGGELAALLQTCDSDLLGVRDAAIISLLYCCGLRRAELGERWQS